MKKQVQRIRQSLLQLLENDLPDRVLEESERLIEDSFRAESYNGQDWQARKRTKDSDKARDKRRALLVQTGNLRRATQAVRDGRFIYIKNDVTVQGKREWSLAQIHNEGLSPVPRRQFIPIPGEPLPEPYENRIVDWLDSNLDTLLT